MATEAFFTFDMDEALRDAVTRSGADVPINDAKKLRLKWDEVARIFAPQTNAGYSTKTLQARWNLIKHRPGLEYKLFSNSVIGNNAQGSKLSLNRGSNMNTGSTPAKGGRPDSRDGGRGKVGQQSTPDPKRPLSASAVRISATRQTSVGQLRGATLTSSMAPVMSFSKSQPKKAGESPVTNSGNAENNNNADGGDDTDDYTATGDNSTMVIHVCDENRGIDKDFTCRKDILLSEMAYFRSYIKRNESCDDIDISVHCDIQIFEWLIKYLNDPKNPPSLDAGNVISILISSQFLKMDRLVQLCLSFVRDNVNDILKLPIDLNCLNNHLLKKLATMFTVDQLDAFVDRKDKLVSKMYMKKLEALFQQDECMLYRCAHCSKLFTSAQRQSCSKAQVFVDFHGRVIAEHVPSLAWDLNNYLLGLRSRKLSWREIYWKLWGLVHSMHCSTCNTTFQAAHLGHCAFHKQNPIFQPGTNTGTYACCGASVRRFDTGANSEPRGCCAKTHTVSTTGADGETLAIVNKRLPLATIPYSVTGVDDDGIGDDDFVDDDEGGDGEDTNSQVTGSDDDDDSDDEAPVERKGGKTGVAPRRRAVTVGAVSGAGTRGGASRRGGGGGGGGDRGVKPGGAGAGAGSQRAFQSDKERRQWRQDVLREEDIRRMNELQNTLEGLSDPNFRVKQPGTVRKVTPAQPQASTSTPGSSRPAMPTGRGGSNAGSNRPQSGVGSNRSGAGAAGARGGPGGSTRAWGAGATFGSSRSNSTSRLPRG